jgi:cell division topological specificity factor
MKLFNLFRPRSSAPAARERLQIILSHERATAGQSDLLAILREEILSAIAKHVSIDRDSIQVRLNRGQTVSALEINVEIPCSVRMPLVSGF